MCEVYGYNRERVCKGICISSYNKTIFLSQEHNYSVCCGEVYCLLAFHAVAFRGLVFHSSPQMKYESPKSDCMVG